MDVTIKDIENLARLSRIEMSEEEKQDLLKDFVSILGYVSEINQVANADLSVEYSQKNITRPDELSVGTHEYTEVLLEEAPGRVGSYVKVNQVF